MVRQTATLGLALSLLAGPVHAQPAASFTVGSATARPGELATGVLDVPAGSDVGTEIAVAIFNGARPGPALALVSGAHGTEYASIIALERVLGAIDPAGLAGRLIVVPLVNVASFLQKVPHVNPVDGKNMNRTYPGRMDGSQSERAAFLVTREIVDKCDYLIDLHGGDLDENLRPYSYWNQTGNAERDAASKELALAFGLDQIIISTDRPKDPAQSRYLDNTAATRGKPALTAEAGRIGRTDAESVSLLARGVLSVMKHLKMIEGKPERVDRPIWFDRVDSVTSDATGIFYPLVEPSQYVAQGTLLGYVTDYYGKRIAEGRAPFAGVVLYVCGVPSMSKGGTIASVGHVLEGAEPKVGKKGDK